MNQIEHCQKLGNVIRIINMSRICSNDARMKVYDFMNRAGYRDTYSALWCVRKLAFDPGRLSEHP